MPVPVTLASLPPGISPADAGQIASQNSSHLISLLHSPAAFQRLQQFMVIPSATHAPNVTNYQWTVQDGGTTANFNTTNGRLQYTPANTGTLQVTVALRNASNTALETISLNLAVDVLLPGLETLIDTEDNGPAAAHPATSRELMNDYRGYVDALVSPTAEPLLNKLILSITYNRCMARTFQVRQAEINSLITSLDGGTANALVAGNVIGICGIRPQLAAMILEKTAGNPFITYTALPAARAARTTAQQGITTSYDALTPTDKIALFNWLSIPRLAVKACLQIVTKLRDEIFAGQSWQDVLGDTTKGRQLITHFETGPWVAAPSATSFARSTFTLMSHPLWNVNARALAGAAPGAGAGAGAPPAGAAPIGSPEIIPEITYIATPKENDNGYIRTAEIYHETYGLNPIRVTSWEDIITRLSQATGTLARVRVVSHFYFPPGTTTAESNMNMPFFTGADRYTKKNDFRFAISDQEGLLGFLETTYIQSMNEGYFTNDIDVPYGRTPPPDNAIINGKLWKAILKGIRAAPNAAVLVPFGIETNDPTSQPLLKIVKCATDLWYLDKVALSLVDNVSLPTRTVAAGTAIMTAFKDRVAALIAAQTAATLTGARTQTQLNDLVAAIRGLAPGSMPIPLSGSGWTQSLLISEPKFLENHDVFRANLLLVRARIASTTHIDIRGCQIARDPAFMTALDTFLTNGAISPVITAPEWFQSFTPLGFITIPTLGLVDTTFSSGGAGFAGADVQREYGVWSGRIGINSHMLFWQQVAALDDWSFLQYQWNQQMPALALTPVKLNGFAALSYPDMLTRLAEIFDLTASLPADPPAFETANRAHINTLRSELTTIAAFNASTTTVQLTDRRTALQTLATALSQTLPSIPAPITLEHVQACATQLRNHLVTSSGVTAFKTALNGKIGHTNAGIRYLLMTGFPLAVQQASDENNLRLLMFDAVKDDALEIWMQMQFTGTRPAASQIGTLTPIWSPATLEVPNDPATNNDDDLTDLGRSLQTALLSFPRTATMLAINPTYEYADHIKST